MDAQTSCPAIASQLVASYVRKLNLWKCTPRKACRSTVKPVPFFVQPELELDSKKLNGGYTTRSALDTLPPFHLDMGVGGTDSPPRCVIVHLTNPGERMMPAPVRTYTSDASRPGLTLKLDAAGQVLLSIKDSLARKWRWLALNPPIHVLYNMYM